MHRRRLLALVMAVQAAMAISALPAHAGVVVTKSLVSAVGSVEIPWAGEDVLLSGDLQAVFVTSIEDSGDILVRYSFQAAAVKGVGATTGLPYLLVGEGHGTSSGRHGQAVGDGVGLRGACAGPSGGAPSTRDGIRLLRRSAQR